MCKPSVYPSSHSNPACSYSRTRLRARISAEQHPLVTVKNIVYTPCHYVEKIWKSRCSLPSLVNCLCWGKNWFGICTSSLFRRYTVYA
ncbi:MAG: hypothetical protein PF495_20185, partial [Spirochaetales bacterium]|nr:hypothetical protein [Spirochaetales bacterium]